MLNPIPTAGPLNMQTSSYDTLEHSGTMSLHSSNSFLIKKINFEKFNKFNIKK